jgi:MFS family permease
VHDIKQRPRKGSTGMYFGWWIVVGGAVLQGLQGGFLFHGFSAFFVFLERDFGWGKAALSGAFSITRVESAILGPIQGWLIDKCGPAKITIAGMLLFGLGFILFSRVQSLLGLYVAFVAVAVGSSLGGLLPVTASLVNWFVRKRAMAVGIAMSGMAIGGLVLVPLLAWSMTTFGWREAAFVAGITIWVVGCPAALVLRRFPQDYGLLPDGDMEVSNLGTTNEDGQTFSFRADVQADFNARQAMRTPAFWLLSLGHSAALLSVSAASVHQIPLMVEQAGLSVQGAANVVAFLMAVQVAGQIGGGYIGDRFDKRLIIIICMFGHTIGMIFLALASSVPPLLLFALFHGLAWGVRGPLVQSIRADYFGSAAFATIMGYSSLVMMVGMTAGALAGGILADFFGDYRFAFVSIGILTGMGSLFFVFARKPSPPQLTS